MKRHIDKSVISGRELQARKDAARQKDMDDLKAGVSGESIARRNGCLPVESVRKARIIFA